jgi:hypothetical protein
MDLCIYAEDFIMIYTSSGLMWWKKLYKHWGQTYHLLSLGDMW